MALTLCVASVAFVALVSESGRTTELSSQYAWLASVPAWLEPHVAATNNLPPVPDVPMPADLGPAPEAVQAWWKQYPDTGGATDEAAAVGVDPNAFEDDIVDGNQIETDAAQAKAREAHNAALMEVYKVKIGQQTTVVADAKSVMDAKVAVTDAAKTPYDAATGTRDTALQSLTSAASAVETATSDLQSAQGTVTSTKATYDQAVSDAAAAKTALDNVPSTDVAGGVEATKAYNSAQALVTSTKATYDAAVTAEQEAQTTLTNADTAHQTAQTAYDSAQSDYLAKKATYDTAKAASDAATAAYTTEVSALEDLKTKEAKLQADVSRIEDEAWAAGVTAIAKYLV